MAMEEALIARLAGAAGIAALAGSRISWAGRVRGDPLPCLVLHLIAPGRAWSHDGPDGLDHPRVQFDAWAATLDDALALARAVRGEMEQAASQDGVTFHPAMLASAQWTDEGEQDGGSPLFRASQDFQFYYEE